MFKILLNRYFLFFFFLQISSTSLSLVSGKELIQSSGDRLRLLVARSDWMAKAIQTDC